MDIVVISGKGGTGKSMLSASLIKLFDAVGVDCDVDEPNLGIWLGITEWQREPIYLKERPKITGELKKVECEFGALRVEDGKVFYNPFLCEGCGLCALTAEPKNIVMEKVLTGWFLRAGKIFAAELEPGMTGSGQLVSLLKEKAKGGFRILDGAAGIGCPVIASVRGADYALIVVEPSKTGFYDFIRVKKVVDHFGVPSKIIVNKFDLNESMIRAYENYGEVLTIPYDEAVFKALSEMRTPIDVGGKAASSIKEIKKVVEEWIFV